MNYLDINKLREIVPASYDIERNEDIGCISSTAAILRHRKSGARLAVFINEDENKLFSAAFRTPPVDDCGTPHIIEHSVLCGSERYPVKDPFMQLVKSSMQTFLNAMTYADKTVYPVSSCNDRDFINLSNVYLDAVFAPNIVKRPEIFMQEGWHYEPTEDGGLEVGGVVYSEMMGATSSPDSNVYDGLICALFPDNAYGRNSGGDPKAIPSLTYERFLEFYREHYHPSNCFITLYGNMDFAERLDYIDREYLSKYDEITPDTAVEEQHAFGFTEPKRVRETYPVPTGEEMKDKTFLAYGAVCADSLNVIDCMAYDFLADILVEAPGAPIKNALVSAGIGQEIYGGFLNHMKQPVFSVISKNTEEAELDRFYGIITESLEKISREGVNKKSLLAAIERSEFRFREGEQGSTSKGLNVTLSMLQSWLYTDEAPFEYLKADEILAELRRLLDTDYYESLIKRLLDSDHSALYVLAPEEGLNEKNAAKLKEKLADIRASMTDEEYDTLCDSYEAFCEYQDREESEEELKCIPLLSKDDISPAPTPIGIRESTVGSVPAVIHDIDTNGIAYVKFMFDISHVPNEDMAYIDILSNAFGKVNTASSAYPDIIDEVKLNTGGFGFGCEIYRRKGTSAFRPMYEINIRALVPKFEKATDIAYEIISETCFDDTVRLRELLSEMVSEKQRDIVSAGSEFASARALAYFNAPYATEDHLDGISAYFAQRDLLADYDNNSASLSAKLKSLTESIFVKSRCMVSIASDKDNVDTVTAVAERFVGRLAEGEPLSAAERQPLGKLNEGFMTTSQVQYCAAAGNLTDSGYTFNGKYRILASVLKNDYLYPEIRMKGGAYGYSCNFAALSGNMAMVTYRDPCLAESYGVFKRSGDYLREMSLNDSALSAHVIGVFGREDRPKGAYVKSVMSLMDYMTGNTHEDICRSREEMLSVTADELRDLAASVDSVLSQGYICTIGNEEKILENKDLFENIVRLN